MTDAHPTATRLVGHILFVETGGPAVVLDCLLAEDADALAEPYTLVFIPASRRTGPDRMNELLTLWAATDALVDVRASEGPDGTRVEVASGNTRVILVPSSSG